MTVTNGLIRISFNICKCPLMFPSNKVLVRLSLSALFSASNCTNWCSGRRFSIASKAFVGVLRITPVVDTVASLCNFSSLFIAHFFLVFGHHTNEAYVILGRIIAVYIQWIIAGLSPHLFPKVLLLIHSAFVALPMIWFKCWFQLSL